MLKYLLVLLAMIIFAFALPPYLLANQFYEEDRIYKKKNPVDEDRNVFLRFSADLVLVFTVLEGGAVGLVSDIVLTPVILAFMTLGIIIGIPVTIYRERQERSKIHR